MRRITLFLIPALAWMAAPAQAKRLTIANSLPIFRSNEIVEVDTTLIPGGSGKSLRILDSRGKEVTHQITHSGKLIFPAEVGPESSAVYEIVEATPGMAYDTIACGAFYPRRKDDLAWENDRVAFRAYGPALQASGERAFGYDIWTKSVSYPVVARRYHDTFENGKNFHDNHGDGMDVYTVGPTLGGGTAALINREGDIIYPYCFETYEILDNGPLRFTVRFTYSSSVGEGAKESRVISLDAGEYLNRTEITFAVLPDTFDVAPGIVVHAPNPDGYVLREKDGVMAYADPTDNPTAGNGMIFVGVVAPEADRMTYQPLDKPEGDAIGHLLAKSRHEDSTPYLYYWGSGWSEGSMPDMETWLEYLATFRQRIDHPLKIEM